MAGVKLALDGVTVAALATIVTTSATAVVRVIVAKGKYRATAADVLVDSALHMRQANDRLRSENLELRSALATIADLIDLNGAEESPSVAAVRRAARTARHVLDLTAKNTR